MACSVAGSKHRRPISVTAGQSYPSSSISGLESSRTGWSRAERRWECTVYRQRQREMTTQAFVFVRVEEVLQASDVMFSSYVCIPQTRLEMWGLAAEKDTQNNGSGLGSRHCVLLR